MSESDGALLSLQIAAMLAAALLCGQIAKRLRLPVVLGEIVGGLLLGPTVLGAVAPALYARLFPAAGPTVAGRWAITSLGMLFFLFAAGLEVNVGQLRRLGRAVATTSALGIVVPFGATVAFVLILPSFWEPHATGSVSTLALLLGTILSISALPVIARILMDLDLQRTEVGTIVLGAATIDDLVGWSIFAALVGSVRTGGGSSGNPLVALLSVLALAAIVLTLGRWLVQRTRPWARSAIGTPGGLIALALVASLVAAVVAHAMGIHPAVGAFFVGLALSQGRAERDGPHEVVYQFAMGIFAPIYFASIGLKTNFAANFDPLLVLVVFVLACVGKLAGASIGARLGGLRARQAWAIGFGMNARGAMGILLATLARDAGLIGEKLFVALVTMALVTSLISGPAMARLLAPAR